MIEGLLPAEDISYLVGKSQEARFLFKSVFAADLIRAELGRSRWKYPITWHWVKYPLAIQEYFTYG